jgi:hypothetical protein
MVDSKRCFMIGPIGAVGSPERKRSDQVLKHIFTPAAQLCGYEVPVRADHISDPGTITRQIVERLLEDPLVLADLTGHNANVFYELAIRHAVFKPVVQIIKTGESIPFDVAVMRTVQVDLTDPDSVEAARDEVARQIRAVEADPSHVDTPLATAIDVLGARKGGRSDQAKILEELGRLTEAVSGLPREVAAKLNTISFPPNSVVSVIPGGNSGEFAGPPVFSRLVGPSWRPTGPATVFNYQVESGHLADTPLALASDPPAPIKVPPTPKPPTPPTPPRRPPSARR